MVAMRADLELRDVAVCGEDVLGDAVGLPAIEEALEQAIAALCAEAVGIMESLNQATLEYVRTRVQFGRPIGQFQVLQHRIADMFILTTQALDELPRKRAVRLRGCGASSPHRAAKAFIGKPAGESASRRCSWMVAWTSAELPVSHYFKRLTAINATFGDIDHQLRVVAESMR